MAMLGENTNGNEAKKFIKPKNLEVDAQGYTQVKMNVKRMQSDSQSTDQPLTQEENQVPLQNTGADQGQDMDYEDEEQDLRQLRKQQGQKHHYNQQVHKYEYIGKKYQELTNKKQIHEHQYGSPKKSLLPKGNHGQISINHDTEPQTASLEKDQDQQQDQKKGEYKSFLLSQKQTKMCEKGFRDQNRQHTGFNSEQHVKHEDFVKQQKKLQTVGDQE